MEDGSGMGTGDGWQVILVEMRLMAGDEASLVNSYSFFNSYVY